MPHFSALPILFYKGLYLSIAYKTAISSSKKYNYFQSNSPVKQTVSFSRINCEKQSSVIRLIMTSRVKKNALSL